MLPPPRQPPPGHLPPPTLPPPGQAPPPYHSQVLRPQHAGGMPPPMMPPPMMPPPMMPPPMVPPPQMAMPPGVQYGADPAASMYGAQQVYAAPAAAAPPPGPSGQEAVAAAGGAAPAAANSKGQKKVAIVRQAAGERWVDPTLMEWPENDFRIFVGNLGNEVTDSVLAAAFSKYSSYQRAKVVRFSHNNKTKGYGFVSLMDPEEGAKCLREMNGKYIGNRPCSLKRSDWDERNVVDRRTGKAKKREVVVKGPHRPKKRPHTGGEGRGGGFLHR